jgi:HEAT repeat protein
VSGSLSVKLQATLVNALEKEPRAKASEILRRAFEACDLSVARANAGAGPGWVRAAAIERLAASKEAADWTLVQATLRDPSEEAVIAAAGAVGRHKLAAAVPDLVALEANAPMPVRRAAVAALGKIGGPDALEPIWRAANSDDLALQRIALTAMGDCQDPRSADFLVNTWLRGATAPGSTSDLGAAARAALLRIGGDKARMALRNKLDIPKASARAEVAIALSELGDAAAVPALLEGLDGPRDPRVQAALVAVTCQDYFSSSDAPKLYRGWWATHRASTPAEWFAEACSAESAVLAVDASLLTNGKSLAAVPSLIQVLTQSNEWYLRTNAVRYLEAATGRSFGAVDKTTPSEERRRIANEYQRLYEGVKQ